MRRELRKQNRMIEKLTRKVRIAFGGLSSALRQPWFAEQGAQMLECNARLGN